MQQQSRMLIDLMTKLKAEQPPKTPPERGTPHPLVESLVKDVAGGANGSFELFAKWTRA